MLLLAEAAQTGTVVPWWQVALVLSILVGAVYGFISERYPPDVTALLALLALLLTTVLTPAEAFAGFSHPATVSVAAVLVLSAGLERTGAITFIARRVLAPLGRSEMLLTVVLMGVIGVLSAFINNTAAVAIFIPVVIEVCRRTGARPGRLLMPMSHTARFGGMCTLIGTSTNLVAHEYARSQGLDGFGMFELGKVGLPMMLLGSAYVLLVGRWFLPTAPLQEPEAPGRPGEYVAELAVKPGSPWIGRELKDKDFIRDHDLELVRVVRNDEEIPLSSHEQVREGDRIRVRGPLEHVLSLAAHEGLEHHRPGARGAETPEPTEATPDARGGTPAPQAAAAPAPSPAPKPTEAAAPAKPAAPPAPAKPRLPLSEFVVLPGSSLLGRTLKGARFAERHDAVVLALHRPGERLPEQPGKTPIRAGDVLVVEGESVALKALADTPGYLLVGSPAHSEQRPGKLWIALVTLAGVIAAVSFDLLPIVTAATAGCAVLMVTGCLRPREAYQAIDWSIIFLLAGALALATALEKTQVTHMVGNLLGRFAETTGPFLVLAVFMLAAIVISEFMSNSGTVALLGPVAVSTGNLLGINPMALLAAVTFGASAAFAMPIGYQTSLMIYGPGGYRFRDFVRMGIPLDILLAALALYLIPRYWPLAAP